MVKMNMRAVRFLHIPKTAGTTFSSILKRQYFGKKTFRFTANNKSDQNRYSALSAHDKAKIALYFGHAPFISGLDNADNAIIITFLRDPISRVKSFCQHVSEGKSPYLLNRFPPSTFDLDVFLDSGIIELENIQSRALIDRWENGSYIFDSLSPEEAIDIALDVLFNKVSYYGLQEYFDESLIIFSSALGWKLPVYASKNKKKINKQIQFKERHLQKIAELNQIDIVLYKHAREHFMSMLSSSYFDEGRLKKLQAINKLGAPIIFLEDKAVGLARWLFPTTL